MSVADTRPGVRISPADGRLVRMEALYMQDGQYVLEAAVRTSARAERLCSFVSSDFVHWRQGEKPVERAQIASAAGPAENSRFYGDIEKTLAVRNVHGEWIRIACLRGTDGQAVASLPCLKTADGTGPLPALENLRIWKREWKYKLMQPRFCEEMRFCFQPAEWPNIQITPKQKGYEVIEAEQFEVDAWIDVGRESLIEMHLFGVPLVWDAKLSELRYGRTRMFAIASKGILHVRMWRDCQGFEVYAGGNVLCGLLEEAGKEISMTAATGTAWLARLTVYGLRSPHFSPAAQQRMGDGQWSASPVYTCHAFDIFPDRVVDRCVGEPPAYVPDRDCVLSPLRVVEEFDWRATPWNDMTRVIDRGDC